MALKSPSCSFKWKSIAHQQYYNGYVRLDVLHVDGNAEVGRIQACIIYSLRFARPPAPCQRSIADTYLQGYHA